MEFNINDKITSKDLPDNQYYKLSSFDTGLLFWDCDLYENDTKIKSNIELNLDLDKYYSKCNGCDECGWFEGKDNKDYCDCPSDNSVKTIDDSLPIH